jgi:hypothetical protein
MDRVTKTKRGVNIGRERHMKRRTQRDIIKETKREK